MAYAADKMGLNDTLLSKVVPIELGNILTEYI